MKRRKKNRITRTMLAPGDWSGQAKNLGNMYEYVCISLGRKTLKKITRIKTFRIILKV